MFVRFLNHEYVQNELNRQIQARNARIPLLENTLTPYPEFRQSIASPSNSKTAIFVSGRFRSGSTLMWQIFRQVKRCTAYYEPLNERRWFNQGLRGEHTDTTHLGVDDYWNEYNGLDHLSDFYNEDWIRSDLLMDERSWNPQLKAYIDELIEHASGDAVLQFNRADFRLPWLKRHFPNSKIVHIYRHPRDQWVSFLRNQDIMNKDDVQDTYTDAFYLDVWCADLARYFPFLSIETTPHPYQRFYYLWKLSYLYGQHYSDVSIGFEDVVSNPETILNKIFDALHWDDIDLSELLPLIIKPQLNKWKQYAEDSWFEKHESECEAVLLNFLFQDEAH